MEIYRVEATITEDGSLAIRGLPFAADIRRNEPIAESADRAREVQPRQRRGELAIVCFAEWTRARFPMSQDVAYSWSGQVLEPVDSLAFIGKNPGDENFNRVMEEIKSVTNQPVKFVINTQHHPDHVGNNQKFIDAGAQVVALEALKKWMGDDPRTKDIPGRPTQTFAKDYTLKLGDAEVRMYSFGRGHSGGDTMVYFPDAKIVMVSDQITDGTPVIDFANGGDIRGMLRATDAWLKASNDQTKVVVGHGPLANRNDIAEYREMLLTSRDRIERLVREGKTEEQVVQMRPLKDLDAKWAANDQAAINHTRNVYNSFKRL